MKHNNFFVTIKFHITVTYSEVLLTWESWDDYTAYKMHQNAPDCISYTKPPTHRGNTEVIRKWTVNNQNVYGILYRKPTLGYFKNFQKNFNLLYSYVKFN